MHVIAFVVYGILSGLATALAGYLALRLCGVPRPPLGSGASPSASVSTLRRVDAQ